MSKFLRLDEGKKALEAAIKTYADEKGNEISLVSCVHVAESEFFNEIKSYSDSKEKVLYEGVGSKEARGKGQRDMFGNMINEAMAWGMSMMTGGLKYQTKEIDYFGLGDNWEPCDVSFGEMIQGSLKPEEIQKFVGMLFSPQNAETAKKMKEYQSMSQREMIARSITGDGPMPMEDMYIAKGRNEVLSQRLKSIFDSKEAKEVAVFYGAAHMTGIEEYITKDLGFKEKDEKWVEAFKY